MKPIYFYIFFILFCFGTGLYAQKKPPISKTTPIKNDTILSPEETKLFNKINLYRKENGKNQLKLSKKLSFVAKTHANDISLHPEAVNDSCNLHSWSKFGSWKGMCYTRDHKNAGLMWSKPSELTTYSGNGYEISSSGSGGIDAESAFNLWKNSPGHNDCMLTQGAFKITRFEVMGIAILNGHANVWFGEVKN